MRVDDDVTLDPTCVAKLYSELQCHDDWGIAAPIVWWGDKTYGHYTDDYNTSRVQWRGHKDDRPKIVKHVGTTFMYRVKDAFDIGGWPLCYSRVAYREETDFCFRMRLLANKDIAVVPKAFSHHHLAKHGGISRSDKEYAELELKDKETFAKRAKEWGVEDPDYEVDNNLLGVWDTLEYY
jgi:GT2 family glycosyltransferase